MQHSNKRVKLGNEQKYTSASWREQCTTLLDSIFQMEDSTSFRYPVNLNEYTDYRDSIDCPMDLSTVREKLNNNYYIDPVDFCKDMRLIFQNSRNYNTNKRSRIYSMTIRLSAMFEERIRSIVSDWRSAVKYETKIRNNQYVRKRRRPIPVQETGVNVGASTSRGFPSIIPALPSTSRGESSKITINKVLNSAFNDGPRNSSSTRISNSTGRKKIIKSERSPILKPPTHVKKKHVNNSNSIASSSLTNGVLRRRPKRKFPERTSKRRTQNMCKREPSNSEGSRSDSNGDNQSSSPVSNSSTDTKWCKQNKRLRRDANYKIQNRLRPRNIMKHKRHSSSLLTRHTRRFGLRSRSSSPENREVTVKKSPEKVSLSPLHTRSQRYKAPIIHHCLRSSTQKPQKNISGDGSESDESAVNNESARTSNSSNSQNTSSKKVFPKNRSSVKHQEQTAYNESEEGSDVEEKPRKLTRATAKVKSIATRALTALSRRESPQKMNSRIQTRNRGQRTVRYGEDSNDDEQEEENDNRVDDADDGEDSFKNSDSENTEPVFSFSSRGRLRKLTNHVRAFFRD